MSFTTQALASVAYQVGNLAGHTLRMLDLQAASLRQVEAHVSTLGQVRGVGSLLASVPNSSAPLGHSLQQNFSHAFLQVLMPTPPQELGTSQAFGVSLSLCLCLSAGPCYPVRLGRS